MNTLHLLLVALLLHRALVWRDERRTRDLLDSVPSSLVGVFNHALAISVVPIVIVFVLVYARREILAHPGVLLKSLVAFVVGLLPYLYIPRERLAGPADVYGPLLTWKGFFDLVSGAMFRRDMHFLSVQSATAAWTALPHVLDQLVGLSDVVFVAAGIVGLVVLLVRDRWFGLLLALLAAVNVYIYANYLGDLPHYLLTTWLLLCDRGGDRRGGPAAGRDGLVRLPGAAAAQVVVFLTAHRPARRELAGPRSIGQSRRREVRRRGLQQLPPNAVLITYWDALTTLSYEHCNEGVRPDVSLRAYDTYALVTCDKVEPPLTSIAEGRPVFALQVEDHDLGVVTGLQPVVVSTITVPWGDRYPSIPRPLYQLVVPGTAP